MHFHCFTVSLLGKRERGCYCMWHIWRLGQLSGNKQTFILHSPIPIWASNRRKVDWKLDCPWTVLSYSSFPGICLVSLLLNNIYFSSLNFPANWIHIYSDHLSWPNMFINSTFHKLWKGKFQSQVRLSSPVMFPLPDAALCALCALCAVCAVCALCALVQQYVLAKINAGLAPICLRLFMHCCCVPSMWMWPYRC